VKIAALRQNPPATPVVFLLCMASAAERYDFAVEKAGRRRRTNRRREFVKKRSLICR
jgi:hypothetical protein